MKRVSVTVDLLPERRVATIENAWVADADVRPGESAGEGLPAPLSRRAHRARFHRQDSRRASAKGDHRILLSDADTLNRMQNIAGIGEPLHGYAGDGVADQSGAQQQQAVRFAGGSQPHGLFRRQDAAQPAVFGVERDAGRPRANAHRC